MKTITMMQLRKSPGDWAHLVWRHGESLLVTIQGKPAFKMVPVDADPERTVIHSDGTITGPKPLTFRNNLGGEYSHVAS